MPATPTGQTLREMYDAMKAHFGHQGWWPGDSPLEICIGAILTQNTSWTNVEKAIANLNAAGAMSIAAINEMDHATLAELIRPSGYYNRKAKRLKNFIGYVADNWGDDLDGFLDRSIYSLTEDLMSVNGIGRETADSIILYAAGKPTFVVDTYTARIALRHNLIYDEAGYDEIKDTFQSNLDDDPDLFNDFHAQLVAVGKTYCRPKNPKCDQCPLGKFPHEVEQPF